VCVCERERERERAITDHSIIFALAMRTTTLFEDTVGCQVGFSSDKTRARITGGKGAGWPPNQPPILFLGCIHWTHSAYCIWGADHLVRTSRTNYWPSNHFIPFKIIQQEGFRIAIMRHSYAFLHTSIHSLGRLAQ
jgi:hypothetical protein